MKRAIALACMLLLVAAPSFAAHKPNHVKSSKVFAALPVPQNVACPIIDGAIQASWDAVEGATKYSVAVEAGYDLNMDGFIDAVEEYDFSAMASPRSIPMSDLLMSVDTNADEVDDMFFSPTGVVLKVKGLNPGKKGPQRHPFSEQCRAL